MNNKIFIFRLAKGNNSGNPIGGCPLDYQDIKKQISELKKDDIQKIDYEEINYLNFLHNELWSNNTLRQGWGIKNLDLKQSVKSWIENYMLQGKIFWNEDIECHTAKGRWNIISRMNTNNMRENDYIIIPKTSNNIEIINDYQHFVVCQVDKTYYFDYHDDIKDFGHCIKVKNLKVFNYSEKVLLRNDFSAPYLWAITEVKEHHSRYNKFYDFIIQNYYKSNNEILKNTNSSEQIFELLLNKGKKDSICIEIRKENVQHNLPHLHITHSDKADVSISLDDFSILAGNIDKKIKNRIMPILKKNKIKLNEIWQELNENDNSVKAKALIEELEIKY